MGARVKKKTKKTEKYICIMSRVIYSFGNFFFFFFFGGFGLRRRWRHLPAEVGPEADELSTSASIWHYHTTDFKTCGGPSADGMV